MVVIPEMQNARPEWTAYIEEQCKTNNIDEYIIKAICFCESSWQSDVGTSHLGLMQISASRTDQGDLLDAITNITIGIQMYSECYAIGGDDVTALNYYNGRDTSEWTSYSTWVMSTAEKIYLSEKRTGYEQDL